jgi:hypothetical protein
MTDEKSQPQPPHQEDGHVSAAAKPPLIDKIKNAAVQMTVGVEGDHSPIKEMIVISDVMHIVKAKGIYRIQLADNVDPDRTNPSIPNTQQRILAFGADCELVRQTLLTAERLFKSKLFGASFNYERPIALTFEALKDIIAMHEMRLKLDAELKDITESLADLSPKNRGLTIPATGDIRVRVETFLQKADHAIADLFEIAKLLYPDAVGRRWFDSLLDLAKEKYGVDATFTKFLDETLPFLKLVRNARNCIEHPKANERLEVSDITMLPSRELRDAGFGDHPPGHVTTAHICRHLHVSGDRTARWHL